ncbi:MAG: insulinase family protein [Bacteroidetes bacterium]|nr:insulinase family protein [Bacteroidota bacterium]
MIKKVFTVAFFLLATSMLPQKKVQGLSNNATIMPFPRFVEEVKRKGDELIIPYKRYELPNGLTVLVHEDHSDPIVYVDVTYHVGSAREQQGRSGFAHFFEHMMFQGSKNVADEQHFKIITESGGTLNGTTNTDRTNYFEIVPSNQLEKMLWLESDRMGFLLDSVTQKKFEVQRATVKNERGQRYDNAPYGLVFEKLGEALFPKGHPYSWTTIGYIEDLNRVDVNDLKRFYMRWYGPNNAVLTISGDVNTDNVLQLVNKYFGSIEKGKDVRPQTLKPTLLSETRYVSYEDNVRFPMLSIAYPSVKNNTRDNAALDVLANILSDGQASPFYKKFIETKKAVSANAFQYSRELDGSFHFSIKANPNAKLADIEKEFKATLDEWEKKGGVTDDDLAKFKATFYSNYIDRVATVQGKGALLAANFTFTGDANYLQKELAMYNSITKADVMRVYEKYIKDKNYVALSCVPKTKGDLKIKEDNWKMYERTIEKESDEYKNLTYKEPKDNFDRSKMPVPPAAQPVPVPDFYKGKLAGEIDYIGVTSNEIPKISILLSFKAGHRFEPIAKSGLSNLTASMLSQSTTKTKSEELENQLSRLGSEINFYTNDEELSVRVQCLKDKLKPTLKVLEEYLFNPKFDSEEFEVEKKQQIDAINQQLTNASITAEKAFRAILYGNNHIMSIPSIGKVETVNALTIDDVKNYYNSKITRDNLSVSVTGDIAKKDIETELVFLGKLKNGTTEVVVEPSLPAISKTTIYFVDKKGAAQSEIKVGNIALPYDALGDFFKANVMNYSFGGAFNSRVNYLLREVKGWTYGTRAGFSGSKYPGFYQIAGGFKANTTDSTIKEIISELKKYAESGINDEELTFTKNAMAQSDALKYESQVQKLFFIKRVLDFNLSKDYVSKQTQLLNAMTNSEINALAKKYLQLNKMIIVVVGDKATNFNKMAQFGFDVLEIDSYGNPIGSK